MTVRLCYKTKNGVTAWWNNIFNEVYLDSRRTFDTVWPLLQARIESHRGRLVIGPASEIEFENQEDATAFLLRWS